MYKSKPMETGRPFTIYAVIVIFALVVIGALALVTGSHQTDSYPQVSIQTLPVDSSKASREIIPSLDMNLSLGETSLYVPKGATNLAGYLSMDPREPNLYPMDGDPGWSRPIVVNIEFRNYQGSPSHNITFFQPVQICFQIDAERWLDFTRRLDAYQVEYHAEGLGVSRWIMLSRSTDPENHEVCGSADHLSLFALAIKPEEPTQTPTPTVATPTSTPTNTPAVPTPLPTRRRPKDTSPGNNQGDPDPGEPIPPPK